MKELQEAEAIQRNLLALQAYINILSNQAAQLVSEYHVARSRVPFPITQ